MNEYLKFVVLLHLYLILMMSLIGWGGEGIEIRIGKFRTEIALEVNEWRFDVDFSAESGFGASLVSAPIFEEESEPILHWGPIALDKMWTSHWRLKMSTSIVCCGTALLILVITWKTRQRSLPAKESALSK